METKTIDDIRALSPCYDPTRYLPEDWTGTALDILRVEECPAEDRLYVVLNDGWIDARTLRLFAVWCARAALARIDNPDPRSVSACDVAERYANGQATGEDLAAARDAAWNAAWAAAGATVWDAAWATAWDAAWATTRATAWDAARDAARADARTVANAARAAQVAHLIEMLHSA